jgi:tRNA/rRNA methyltransferase
LAGAPPRNRLEPATVAEVEFLFERLQAAFLRIGFLNPQNPDHIMFALRRLFGRAELEGSDVRILLGLARQIEWFGRQGPARSSEE